MEDMSYKTRTQGAVGSERMTLLCIIAHYWDELERYENEGGTQRQKWDLWEIIADEFNNHPNVSVIRTPLQVKTLFKNMKTKARKYKQKLEESEALGMIVETDPISETVLKLNKYQSREAVNVILHPLKSLYYLSRETRLDVSSSAKERDHGNNYTIFSSLAADMQNMADDEVVKLEDDSVKDSTVDLPSVSSPCLQSSSSSHHTEYESLKNIPNTSSALEESSQVHTFGDISVTAISADKKETSYSSKLNSMFKLGNTTLENTASINTQRSNPLKRLFSSLESGSPKATSNSSDNTTTSSSGHCNSSKHCCCPEYHNEMLAMSLKEHELKINLLTEEILCQRAERSLHEEERRIREQNFLFKQEERQDAIAEHQARMKVIELEYEALEAKMKSSEKTNKWFRNGSKEI